MRMRCMLPLALASCLMSGAGCARPVLPSLTLAGRAGVDLDQRRRGTWSARVEFDFALRRSAEREGAAERTAPSRVEDLLPAACAGDALCRYLRRAAEHALAAHAEVP